MESIYALGTAVAFLSVGLLLVYYELSRIKLGRPILNGGVAAQSYYILYFAMFVLALTATIKAIVG